jgi:hypothetical protein
MLATRADELVPRYQRGNQSADGGAHQRPEKY